MTNQETPEQGGATEEQIEAAALAMHRCDWPGGYGWTAYLPLARAALAAAPKTSDVSQGTSDELIHNLWVAAQEVKQYGKWYYELMTDAAEAITTLSASASAQPADERHDAEEREAESEDHAATVTGERERGFRNMEAVQGILGATQTSVADATRELSLVASDLAASSRPVEGTIRHAVQSVVWNAANHPKPSAVLGQDIRPLTDEIVASVMAALAAPVEVTGEPQGLSTVLPTVSTAELDLEHGPERRSAWEREKLIAEAETWGREQLPPSPWGDSHVVHRLIAELRGEGR
ncbi:hypothetical protein [Leucobacter sp. NPDC077196]|uniref:hypothetical protein n=1 Tax=Leucobacter sp. NPDC077196 TaxID=3154959 RepID=UPI003433F66D